MQGSLQSIADLVTTRRFIRLGNKLIDNRQMRFSFGNKDFQQCGTVFSLLLSIGILRCLRAGRLFHHADSIVCTTLNVIALSGTILNDTRISFDV